MHYYHFVLFSFALIFTNIALADDPNPDLQGMLDALEHKIRDEFMTELKLQMEHRDEIIAKLKKEMDLIRSECCPNLNNSAVEDVKDGFIDDDVQDALDELNIKVAYLEEEDRQLHNEVGHNDLDIAVIQEDVSNLFLKDKELEYHHTQDHNLVVALVQENQEAIQENRNLIKENDDSIDENYSKLQ